jgi:hypothetical protein
MSNCRNCGDASICPHYMTGTTECEDANDPPTYGDLVAKIDDLTEKYDTAKESCGVWSVTCSDLLAKIKELEGVIESHVVLLHFGTEENAKLRNTIFKLQKES